METGDSRKKTRTTRSRADAPPEAGAAKTRGSRPRASEDRTAGRATATGGAGSRRAATERGSGTSGRGRAATGGEAGAGTRRTRAEGTANTRTSRTANAAGPRTSDSGRAGSGGKAATARKRPSTRGASAAATGTRAGGGARSATAGRAAGSTYPPRRRRSSPRHARRRNPLVAISSTAAGWLDSLTRRSRPRSAGSTRRRSRHTRATSGRWASARSFARKHTSQITAAVGVIIVLLSLYLVRQGLMLPSSIPFDSGAGVEDSSGPAAPAGAGDDASQAAQGDSEPGDSAMPGDDTGAQADEAPSDAAPAGDAGSGTTTGDPAGDQAAGDSQSDESGAGDETAEPVIEDEGTSASFPMPYQTRADCLKALTAPVSGDIVQAYGYSYSEVFEDWRYHAGVDLALASGTQVKASLSGMVLSVEGRPSTGWTVELSHGCGVTTIYSHLGGALVNVGEEVTLGDAIGIAGQPGSLEAALGMHLHFEIRVDGDAIDPTPYVGG